MEYKEEDLPFPYKPKPLNPFNLCWFYSMMDLRIRFSEGKEDQP